MQNPGTIAYGRILASSKPHDVRGHVVTYAMPTAPIQMPVGLATPQSRARSLQQPSAQTNVSKANVTSVVQAPAAPPASVAPVTMAVSASPYLVAPVKPTVPARASTPRRQGRQAVVDETPRRNKEASPQLGVSPLRSVATPCRVQLDTPRRDQKSTPRSSPCRTPPVPRTAPSPVDAITGTAVGAVSSTGGSSSSNAPKVLAPRGVSVQRGAGSQRAPTVPPKPAPAPVMRFSTYPCQTSNVKPKSVPSSPLIQTREDDSGSLTAFDKLYDEDWWYWHLEDRRRGGAPPDAFLRDEGPEICLSAKDDEERLCFNDDMIFTPRKGNGCIRVPPSGLASADLAAGGVREPALLDKPGFPGILPGDLHV